MHFGLEGICARVQFAELKKPVQMLFFLNLILIKTEFF